MDTLFFFSTFFFIKTQFDLLVSCRSIGGDAPREYTFSSIDKHEYTKLLRYVLFFKCFLYHEKYIYIYMSILHI